MSDEIRESLREGIEQARAGESAAVPVDAGGGGEAPTPDAGAADASGSPGPVDAGDSGTGGNRNAVPPERSDRARDASGKFIKAEATPAPKQGKETQVPPPAQGSPTEVKPPLPGVTTPTPAPRYKAPQSWKPALREKWGSLGEEVQAEIDRREKEMAQALQGHAEPKKFYEAFQQIIAPHQQTLAQEGLHPLRAVGDLFQVASGLRANNPGHVAGLIGNMVRQFGTGRFGPQFIETLAAAIDGTPAPQGGAQSPSFDPNQLAQQIEQRVLSQFQQRQQQAYTQKAGEEVSAFGAEKEFFDDVRDEMSALLSSSASRGVAMTLEEAYNRAVWANPDTRAALMQREEKKRAETANAAIQRSQAAASSVKSHPSAVMNGAGDGSIRDTLREALAESRRR